MEELQLVGIEQTEITDWDFESIKAELSKALSVYKTTVYTDPRLHSVRRERMQMVRSKRIRNYRTLYQKTVKN